MRWGGRSLAANADGAFYCLNPDGTFKWKFKKNDPPMYSVCVVYKDATPYVVCGGFDKNIYYLNANGTLKQTLESSTYSANPVFSGVDAPNNTHIANFLCKVTRPDSTAILVVLGTNNCMQVSENNYLFDVLGDLTAPLIKVNSGKPIGEMRICDMDGNDKQEILLVTSSRVNNADVVFLDPMNLTVKQKDIDISSISREVGSPGYRVSQPEIIPNGKGFLFFILHGLNILLVPPDMDLKKAEILKCLYSYNDMWKDPVSGKIILASNHSGGSKIHIIDVGNPDWETAYMNITLPGKVHAILDSMAKVNSELKAFNKPFWERNPLPIYLLHGNTDGVEAGKYNSPVLFHSHLCRKYMMAHSGIGMPSQIKHTRQKEINGESMFWTKKGFWI